MVLLQTLVTLFCIASASSKEAKKSVHCDVPDEAILEQKLNNIFEQLPEEHVVANTADVSSFGGAFFLGKTTIRGLDRLVSDRPYQTFCRGDDTITVFTLRAQSPLEAIIPWSVCSAYNGTIDFRARTVRYEGELVTSKSGNSKSSKIENFSTVQLEGHDVRVTGDASGLGTAVYVLGLVFEGLPRLYWTHEMTDNVGKALRDALKSSE